MIALIFFPFGSVYWPKSLGSLGASPAVPLLLFLGIIRMLIAPNKDHLAVVTRRILLYGIVCSFISLILFGWSNVAAVKTISHFLLAISWFAPLLCMEIISSHNLRQGLIFGLVVCLIGFIISDIAENLISLNIREILFSSEYEVTTDGRARGFNSESSHFAANVGRYLFSLYLLIESNRRYSSARFLIFLCFLSICLVLSGSKGAAIAIGFVLIGAFVSRKTIKYGVLLIPVVFFIVDMQIENISFDIENFTSTSTRTGMFVASLWSFVVNPFGYGYYGFYDVMAQFGSKTLLLLAGLPLLLNEFEYIVGDLTNVSFKSSLLDFLVFFGVVFLFYISYIAKRINLSDPRVRAGFIYFLVTALSVEGHNSITFNLGLAILFVYYKKKRI